jgi:integrase
MKGRKLKMSPAWLDALKPGPKPCDYRDTEARGLVLRVEVSGLKTWVVRYSYAGRERRFRIGAYPEVGLKGARDEAERQRGKASLGSDPQAEREKVRLGETVTAALDVWLEAAETRAWRPRSRDTFLSHVGLRIRPRLGPLKLAEVSRAHVLTMLDSIEGAATRNRCLTVTRLFFRWCINRALLEADPTMGIEKLPEEPRERTLSDEELRELVRAFDGTRWGGFVRLLLLTAVRRDELLGARWSDMDRERGVWTIAPAAEKAGRKRRGGARKVLLSPAALAVLTKQREANLAAGVGGAPWVFPTGTGNRAHRDAIKPTLNVLRGRRPNGTTSADKRAKKREAVIPLDVDLHDLRRSVADRMLNALGVSAYTVDVGVLGHRKPALLGVYAPTAPLKDTAAAMKAWGVELARILGEPVPKSGARA